MASADTRPTDTASVIRHGRSGPELVQMRWGWMPSAAGEPIINLRAESADISRKRCLVPATEIDLFTAADHPRRRWRVTLKGEPVFFFAGLWHAATDEWPESYAIITIGAGADLRPLTDTQPLVITPTHVADWLESAGKAAQGSQAAAGGQLSMPPLSYSQPSLLR